MAKRASSPANDGATLQNTDVSDETVSQVGKAVAEILKLRQTFEDNVSTAQTDDERQNLADEVETAAVRAISEQGLTVTEYNEVISAAQSDGELEQRVLSACRAS